jgi:allantoicase
MSDSDARDNHHATATAAADALPAWAHTAVNLADARFGARAIACSDEFFAPMERLLQPGAAVFVPGKYDDHGKWMDGWESRRRRGPGYDWCVVALGVPGSILGFDVDTSFFTGNYPPSASVDGCPVGADPQLPTSWIGLLSSVALSGNRHHYLLARPSERLYSHVRLNIFPDGGVARLRVYGRPSAAGVRPGPDGLVDLVARVHGGRALCWNDAHFGHCDNLLLPGRGINMGDGWETRRRREPGHDWCILALGLAGRVRRIEVDTAHYKGNYPDACSLQAANLPGGEAASVTAQSQFWDTLLPNTRLGADAIHTFESECVDLGPITHVRFNIHPDGGVSRLRLWGERA